MKYKIPKLKMMPKTAKRIKSPKSPKANKPGTAHTPKFKGKSAFGKTNDGKNKKGDDIGSSEKDMNPIAAKMARRKRLEGVRM